MSNVDEFMQGGSRYPMIRINSVGGKLVGDLVEARLVDERDFDTGKVVKWDNGDPKQQLALDVRVDWSASVDVTTGKDGERAEVGTYFVRYTAFLALQAACEAAGCKMSQVGRLAIARTPDGTPRNPRHAPPQQFVAEVAQRVAEAGVDSLLASAQQAPVQQAPVQQAAPPAQPLTASGLL